MSIHTCSYYCERPDCIRAQRDELRQKIEQAESLDKQDEIKALIEDLRLNHEFCPKEVILQAADELEKMVEADDRKEEHRSQVRTHTPEDTKKIVQVIEAIEAKRKERNT
jgi:hypothetical protein